MRILFIGCVESSYVFLKALLNNGVDIVGVITKESSSFNADFVDITPLCKKNNVPFIFVKNINDENAVEFIKECNPVMRNIAIIPARSGFKGLPDKNIKIFCDKTLFNKEFCEETNSRNA